MANSGPSFKRGSYLENYLESISTLPAELRRNFTLMRELDQRSQETIDAIDEAQKQYLHALRRAIREQGEEPGDEIPNQIRQDFKKCMEYADEKVALAVQTYELVDKHIRRLDNDLKKFEAELDQGPAACLSPVCASASLTPSPALASGSLSPAPEGKDRRSTATPDKKRRDKGAEPLSAIKKHKPLGPVQRSEEARTLTVDLDMPIDPNEPTYCICNRVSFGEMVGCDNPDCKIEWFHFECVGLTAPPKGKWYCPECSAQMRNKMRR